MIKPEKLVLINFLSYEEVEYDFRDGQVTIVVGDNLDNSSQKGNGSGKSGLLEGFSFAMKGTSIRDCKVKELIRKGQEQATVLIQFKNTQNDQSIVIQREIFANSKAGTYEMYVDDEDMKDHYSDANMFNDFVWKIMGISKEDFDSFFLITSANYEPFLKVGDNKKKDIINRFSGANQIDAATPLIEADVKKLEEEIIAINNEQISLKTKIELWQSEIKEIEEEPSSKDEWKKGEEELILLDEKLIGLGVQYDKDKHEWGEVGFEIATFIEKPYDDLISKEEEKINEEGVYLEACQKNLKAVPERFDIKVIADDIEKREKENADDTIEYKTVKQGFEELQAELTTKLKTAIECPKCHHTFNVQDKEFDVESAKEMLKEVEEELSTVNELLSLLKVQASEFKDDWKAYKQTVHDAEEEIKKEISFYKENILHAEDNIRQFKNEKSKQDIELRNLKQKQESLKKKYELNLQEQESLIKQRQAIERNMELALDVVDGEAEKTKRIDKYKKQIKEVEKLLIEKEVSLKALQLEKTEKSMWLTHFKGFKSHLANKSIKNISDYTNLFLQKMGSDISISIEGYKMVNKKIKEEITTQVLRNGFDEGSYGLFSAGERGRIDISVILALQELINLNSPTGGLDFLGCDEILDSLDSLGLESIVKALDGVGKTMMIISQNEINSLKEQTLTIRKQNKISTLCYS